uniref:L-serine deaminase n=1 Tax=Varanus komodoensis TaxID=61221 RepID=A0A8D2J103_VARKO
MMGHGDDGRPFHLVTPVLESMALSRAAGTQVYMKLENVQPAGSFKIRGIGYFCQQVSGGNAGLAAAHAAGKLGIPATIVVPGSATQVTVKKLEQMGADVEVFGKVNGAGKRKLHICANPSMDRSGGFSPYRKGHSSIVKELKDFLGAKPGAIVLSVGGGGLLCGVVSGLQEVGWLDVPVVAVETRGADSLNAAIRAGHLVTLPDITR